MKLAVGSDCNFVPIITNMYKVFLIKRNHFINGPLNRLVKPYADNRVDCCVHQGKCGHNEIKSRRVQFSKVDKVNGRIWNPANDE